MSKICQITGKKAQIGCNVDVNLFSKKFYWVEENCWIRLKISAAGLRMINKVGLDAAIRQAIEKGYLNWNDLEKSVLAWGNVEN